MARWQGNTTSRELTKKIKKKTNDFLKITTGEAFMLNFQYVSLFESLSYTNFCILKNLREPRNLCKSICFDQNRIWKR